MNYTFWEKFANFHELYNLNVLYGWGVNPQGQGTRPQSLSWEDNNYIVPQSCVTLPVTWDMTCPTLPNIWL